MDGLTYHIRAGTILAFTITGPEFVSQLLRGFPLPIKSGDIACCLMCGLSPGTFADNFSHRSPSQGVTGVLINLVCAQQGLWVEVPAAAVPLYPFFALLLVHNILTVHPPLSHSRYSVWDILLVNGVFSGSSPI